MGGKGWMLLGLVWLWLGMVGSVGVGEGSFKLRVVHTNDMHARFEEVSQSTGTCSEYEARHGLCYGGFARVKTALSEELARGQKENVTVLSLNAGDSYQGTVWYTLYKWKVVSHFLKLLPIDAMALGNHEFDDGIEGLTPFLKDVGIPVLAANIDFSKEEEMGKGLVRSSLVLNRGGRKIGVIGYLTPDTVMLADAGKLEFRDEVESLREEAKALKRTGVDIIIALGHSGYDVDLRISAEVEDVDVVVGGHSHTFLYTGAPPDSEEPADTYPVMVRQKNGRRVAMVQAYAFTKYVGILDLTFDDRGELLEAKGNPILLDHKVLGDPEVLREVDEWRSKMNSTLKESIGKTKVLLDGSLCRFYECNLGNLITDAYIHYAVETHSGPYWTKAAIAIQQAGGIRSSINTTAANGNVCFMLGNTCTTIRPFTPFSTLVTQVAHYSPTTPEFHPGLVTSTISREDVITAMPFFSPLSVVRIEGRHLLEALEWSVARYDPKHQGGRGEFLQMSGLRVKFEMLRPAGSRVVSAEARCQHCQIPRFQPVKPDEDYDVIMPTFLFNGGDNFTMFRKYGKEMEKFAHSDTEVAIRYVQRRGPLYSGLENRLQVGYWASSSSKVKSSFVYFLVFLLVTRF